MTAARSGRAAAALGALAALIAAAVLLWPSADDGGGGSGVTASACGKRSLKFSAGRWPDCRRPYAESSPFNRALPPEASAAKGSAATVAWLNSTADVGHVVVGDPARDGGIPVYRSRPRDPLYALHCTKPWGRCEIEGARVRIPAAALPAGQWPDPTPTTDGHMTVVDPRSGWEYDLWQVHRKPHRGGRLSFSWGGRTRIDGDGLGSGAVAAGWGSLAGLIRAPELVSGQIHHALAIAVPCARGHVFPARGDGGRCDADGLPGRGAPPIGAHLRLAMSPGQIRALRLPRWQQGVLLALARYGAFVSDTTGASYWGFEVESEADYRSFGQRDPLLRLADRLGLRPQDFNHNGAMERWFEFSPAIDWGRLQVVAPCVSRGGC